jgi:hypothetical protein
MRNRQRESLIVVIDRTLGTLATWWDCRFA